jgi:hypothetical protein
VQQLLVAVLGDLQAVWSDKQLQELLLGLPLPAIQLLLSSDQLCVPSEDTMLHTAKQYVKARWDILAADAKTSLGQLVRAPQLSMFALSCAALPADSQLLGGSGNARSGAQKLRDQLQLKRTATAEELATALGTFEGAPASWRLGPCQIRLLTGGVRLDWRLPLEQLKRACRDSSAQQNVVSITSPSSAPLGAVGWRLMVQCTQDNGGTVVGAYAGPVASDMPASMYFKFECSISWGSVKRTLSSCDTSRLPNKGYRSFFRKLRPMAGDGWDDAVWAAAGLPAAGDMLLELCVHSVD